jgi:hypothetical protein
MKKINLLLNWDDWTSFHNRWIQNAVSEHFNILWVSDNPPIKQQDTLLVTTKVSKNKWYDSLHQQGFRVLVDNLWGMGDYPLENSFLLWNINWFWYHESLCYKLSKFDQYQPNRTYNKLALMPMGHQKLSHDLLFDRVQDYLDDFIWSYVERTGKQLPNDIDKSLGPWQRHFNPEWYDQTHFSLIGETLVEDKFTLHVTEKSYKPMAFYHPFLTFGQRGILKHLQGQGFETFENLFDESYDQELTIDARLDKVIANIQNFKKCPYDSLTIEKLKHNHELFFNTELVHRKLITEIVEPIINYVETI